MAARWAPLEKFAASHLLPSIGWRGLLLLGLLPVLLVRLIRAWAPESPRWLISQGRRQDARRAIAWAVKLDPDAVELAAAPPARDLLGWTKLLRYRRSASLVCLIGLAQFGSAGSALWAVRLLLASQPSLSWGQALRLMSWAGVALLAGEIICLFLPDLLGRRIGGALVCLGSLLALLVGLWLAGVALGAVPILWLMLMANSFFLGGGATIIGPYMAEVWPAELRASGLGVGYGVINLGKFVSPLVFALIAGVHSTGNQLTSGSVAVAMCFSALWPGLALIGFLLIGIETKGRSIEEIDAALTATPAA